MSVYIDNARFPYAGMLMSHMIADTTSELLAMASTIGVAMKWLQRRNTYREHFDVCQSKRVLAIKAGAIPIDSHTLAKKLKERKHGHR